MNLNTILTGLSNKSQGLVKFLFGSKWTIVIIIIAVVLYFIWIGTKKEKKENSIESEGGQE